MSNYSSVCISDYLGDKERDMIEDSCGMNYY